MGYCLRHQISSVNEGGAVMVTVGVEVVYWGWALNDLKFFEL